MGARALFSYNDSQRERWQKATHDKAKQIISTSARRLLSATEKSRDITA